MTKNPEIQSPQIESPAEQEMSSEEVLSFHFPYGHDDTVDLNKLDRLFIQIENFRIMRLADERSE